MNAKSIALLFLLAAIWGASLMFIKMGAGVFGTFLLMEYRVLFAALFLLVLGLFLGKSVGFRENWRFFAFMGVVNSALPFVLFAYAAKTVDASMMAVLNATSPIFGAVVGALWLGSKLDASQMIGLMLGVLGVYLLVETGGNGPGVDGWLGIGAVLGASLFYGISSNFVKKYPNNVSAFATAHGSMWMASLVLAPLVFAFPVDIAPTAGDWGAVVTLGVLCTGFAYILYFKLIRDVGPMNALSVTFLIPVFGIMWGALILGEVITAGMIMGTGVVLLALALTSGLLKLPIGGKIDD